MDDFVAPYLDPGFLGFWSWARSAKAVRASSKPSGYCGVDAVEAARIDNYELRVHPDDLEWLRSERPRCREPIGAAQQVGDQAVIRSLEAILIASARFLSKRTVLQVAETQH